MEWVVRRSRSQFSSGGMGGAVMISGLVFF